MYRQCSSATVCRCICIYVFVYVHLLHTFWCFSCRLSTIESVFLLNFVGLNEFYCLFSFSCSFFFSSPLSLSLSLSPLFAHLTRSYHFYCCSQFEYLIYYVILRSALCSSSPFGYRLSTLWIWSAPARIHNVATLQQEEPLSSRCSFEAMIYKLPTHHDSSPRKWSSSINFTNRKEWKR